MYKLRLKILIGVVLAGLLVVIGRLGYLQIAQGDTYRQMAADALSSVELLPERRGRILDRNGVILAEDKSCFDLCLDYRFITENSGWIAKQKRILMEKLELDPDLSGDVQEADRQFERCKAATWREVRNAAREQDIDVDQRIGRILRSVKRIRQAVGGEIREERMGHVVVPGLSDETATRLRTRSGEMLGMTIVPSHYRHYPQKQTACHIIGVTGPVYREDLAENLSPDEADWTTRVYRNYLPGDRMGKSGVEKMAEELLRARRGFIRYSRPGKIVQQQDPTPGRDVKLTIDIELQKALTDLMAANGMPGSIVLIDVKTGDILAMVSWPTFDLNRYRQDYSKLAPNLSSLNRADPEYPALLSNYINAPLRHRAIASVFPPGSTVKPLTALAGLGTGQITPQTTFMCNAASNQRKPRCWIFRKYHHGHGPQALEEALKNSCNVYFREVGNLLGGRVLTDWFGYFGFGESPGTGLPEERRGQLGNEAYLRERFRRGFVPSDAWFYSIGQGVFSASCLQVANAHATIARNGVFLSPRISGDGPPQKRRDLPIPASHAEAVQRGMYRVVNEQGGTARTVWRQGAPLNFKIAGKTGTAQASPQRIDSDGDGQLDQIVREGTHAWFAGFAPYQNPEVAFTVVVEYAGGGGKNAAPLAKEALRLAEKFGYVNRGGRP